MQLLKAYIYLISVRYNKSCTAAAAALWGRHRWQVTFQWHVTLLTWRVWQCGQQMWSSDRGIRYVGPRLQAHINAWYGLIYRSDLESPIFKKVLLKKLYLRHGASWEKLSRFLGAFGERKEVVSVFASTRLNIRYRSIPLISWSTTAALPLNSN